jgi:hypothetical protein
MSILAYRRMRRALLCIGPKCHNYTTGVGSCWRDRHRDAQYSADRWCDGCIAAWGLGLPSQDGRMRRAPDA